MMKKKIIICLIVIVAVAAAIVAVNFNSHTNEIAEADQVYLDIEKKAQGYERTALNEEDAERIKSIFTGQDATKEPGFVFEKGKYRIVFKNKEKETFLYPYCGELTTIKLGERGVNYYFFRENSRDYDQLRSILNHYMEPDAMRGISRQ